MSLFPLRFSRQPARARKRERDRRGHLIAHGVTAPLVRHDRQGHRAEGDALGGRQHQLGAVLARLPENVPEALNHALGRHAGVAHVIKHLLRGFPRAQHAQLRRRGVVWKAKLHAGERALPVDKAALA